MTFLKSLCDYRHIQFWDIWHVEVGSSGTVWRMRFFFQSLRGFATIGFSSNFGVNFNNILETFVVYRQPIH